MAEEHLKLAVFVDFDNIQIGVKDTLGKDFDVSVVLEALKERGEVVTKVAYGDWSRASEYSRQMTQHAIQMVQRNVTPRGDKNGADINLALDALELAFNRPYINSFAIIGGDSDFIALVEKLKQYGKHIFVVGGKAFTSLILQRNCHEFIAYENLLTSAASREPARQPRSARGRSRASAETRAVLEAFPNVQRALKILAEREVAPQLGLLKSTLLQLDSTFSERDYGAGSFLEFMQKMQQEGLVHLRRTERGYLVEPANGGEAPVPETQEEQGSFAQPASQASGEQLQTETPQTGSEAVQPTDAAPPTESQVTVEPMELLRRALAGAAGKAPNRPLYLRQVRQAVRSADKDFNEQRFGPRGILDLLHQGQREGLVKLQRDRKGVLRILPVQPVPAGEAAAEPEPELGTPGFAEPESAEIDVQFEPVDMGFDAAAEELAETEQPAETPAPEPSPEAMSTVSPPEFGLEAQSLPEPERKRAKRASRAPRTGPKTATRKAPSRRKAKQTAEA